MENLKDKKRRYMKKYYASHPEQKEKHRLACKKYYDRIKALVKDAKNSV